MDVNVINELQNGLSAAYINGSVAANLAYKPAFVSNNPEEGKKVISSVEDEFPSLLCNPDNQAQLPQFSSFQTPRT